MKRILTISMILMLSVTFVSAYNFNYVKPTIDVYSYPAFLMSRMLGVTNQYTILVYNLMTTARFYETKLYACELELKNRPLRSSGGGGSNPVVQSISTPFEPIILKYNHADLIKVQKNWGKNTSEGDYNNDGIVDGNDLSIVLANFEEETSGEELADALK